MEPQNDFQRWMIRNPRPAGTVAMLLGAFCVWAFLLEPRRQAEAGDERIMISAKAATLGVMFLILGSSMVAAGPQLMQCLFSDDERTKKETALFAVLTILVGAVCYAGLELFLQSKGYR